MPAQLIYTSRRAPDLSDADIDDLLHRARRHNALHGLSGVLLCTADLFMQVLEGSKAEVERLAARIAEDPRHEDMRVIMMHDVPQRNFGAWHMALSDARRAAIAPGGELSRFFEPDFDIAILPEASAASFLVRAFREIAIGER